MPPKAMRCTISYLPRRVPGAMSCVGSVAISLCDCRSARPRGSSGSIDRRHMGLERPAAMCAEGRSSPTRGNARRLEAPVEDDARAAPVAPEAGGDRRRFVGVLLATGDEEVDARPGGGQAERARA